MAKFLWTSRSTETFAGSIADHIAKYCFNAPGNWRVFNETTKVWGLTTGTPGLNPAITDQIFIGAMNFPLGLGWTYGPSGDNGWTSAKHPLLFGGYSGEFRGNWRYLKSDAGIIAGTSWQGHLNRVDHQVSNSLPADYPGYPSDSTPSQPSRTLFHNNVIDYPFPYLGGGISGEIAQWCAARDGLTVGDYVVENYPGFHDPRKNLRLRVLGSIVLQDLRAFTGPDQKMIIDIEPVRTASSQTGLVSSDTDFPGTNITTSFGWQWNYYTANGTNLYIKTCNGVGVRIRGGHLYNVDCNSSSSLDVSGSISPLHVHGRGRLPSERIDYGIEIHDATVMKCNIADGQRTLLRNGNYAKITLLPRYGMGYHRPYVRVGAGWTGTWTNQGGVMYSTQLNSATPFIGITALDHRGMVEMPYNFSGSIDTGTITRFPCDSPPIILANGWNWLKCWWELRGISLGAIDQYPGAAAGKLIFDSSTGVNGYFNTPYYTLNTLQSMFYEPGVQNIANNIHSNPPFGFTPYEFSKQRRNVILGDPENPDFEGANVPNGYQALTGGISEIVVSNITNYFNTARSGIDAEYFPHADQSQELSVLQLPWNLQIASKANIQKITMDNGFMTLSPNLSAAHTVRVNEINLNRNSTIDLSDTKSADFRVGTIFYAPGFSGADGQAYLQGGIKFMDNTCNKIIGSIPHAYWNEINYESTNRGIRHFSAGEIAGGYTATDQSI